MSETYWEVTVKYRLPTWEATPAALAEAFGKELDGVHVTVGGGTLKLLIHHLSIESVSL